MQETDQSGQTRIRRRAYVSAVIGTTVAIAGCSETESVGTETKLTETPASDTTSDGDPADETDQQNGSESLQPIEKNWETDLRVENGYDVEGAATDGDTLAAATDTEMYVFDTETGTQRWSWSGAEYITNVTVDDGLVYIEANYSDSDRLDELVAFDASSGSIAWRVSPPEESIIGVELTTDYIVASTLIGDPLLVYDKKTGEQVRTIDEEPLQILPLGDNQILSFNASSSVKYNLATGEVLWDEFLEGIFSDAATVVDGVLMGVTEEDVLKCLDLQAEPPGSDISELTGVPEMNLTGGRAHAYGYSKGDDTLYALAPDASIAWQKEADGSFPRLAVSEETIALAVSETLYAYDASSGTTIGNRDISNKGGAAASAGRELYVCGSSVASYTLPVQ